MIRLWRRLAAFPPLGLRGWHLSVRVARPRHWTNLANIAIAREVTILADSVFSPITRHKDQYFNPKIVIESGTYIGRHCFLGCVDEINIGQKCVISDFVYITDVTHGVDPDCGPIMSQPLRSSGKVIVGEGCFLGYGVRVMPGVTLGAGCVVATSSVVTKSFEPYTMIAGIPAEAIKRFDFSSRLWRKVGGEGSFECSEMVVTALDRERRTL